MLRFQADPLVERAPLIWNKILGHSLKAGSLSPRASWASQAPGPGQATLQDRHAPLWRCPEAAACGPTCVAAGTRGYAAGAKLLLKVT